VAARLDGEGGFVPFDGFVQASAIWFRVWGLPEIGVRRPRRRAAAVAAVLLFEPHVRRLGVEIRLWSASYVLYLLLVFFPQSSIFRLSCRSRRCTARSRAATHALAVGCSRGVLGSGGGSTRCSSGHHVHADPLIAGGFRVTPVSRHR
jgi:hypothetical protein